MPPIIDPDLEGDEDIVDDPIEDADDEPLEGDDEEFPEDENDENEDGEEEEEPVIQSRGRNAVQRAKDEAKEAREEAKQLKERLEVLERGRTTDTSTKETKEQRETRIAAMEPEDRVLYLAREETSALRNDLQTLRFENFDRSDKNEFRAKCEENQHFKAVAKEVEAELQKQRSQGVFNLNRETLATFLIGKRVAERISGARSKQSDAAAAAKRKQKTSPGSSRSDVTTSGKRGNEADQRRKRLGDVLI